MNRQERNSVGRGNLLIERQYSTIMLFTKRGVKDVEWVTDYVEEKNLLIGLSPYELLLQDMTNLIPVIKVQLHAHGRENVYTVINTISLHLFLAGTVMM